MHLKPIADQTYELIARDWLNVFLLYHFFRWLQRVFYVSIGGVPRVFWDVVAVTHPLLTALARDLHQSGIDAVYTRKGHFLRAQGHTTDDSIHARTLVLAVGLEVLPILVDLSKKFTGSPFRLCWKGARGHISALLNMELTSKILRYIYWMQTTIMQAKWALIKVYRKTKPLEPIHTSKESALRCGFCALVLHNYRYMP